LHLVEGTYKLCHITHEIREPAPFVAVSGPPEIIKRKIAASDYYSLVE